MSNLPQQTTRNQYVGDGTTTVYTYSYLVPTTADISVYVTPAGQPAIPAADKKNLGTDYTVQSAGTLSGGTVTFAIAPGVGSIVTLVRDMEFSIDTEFVEARNYNGQNLDDAFERVTLLCQQLNTDFRFLCLTYAINAYLATLPANILPILTNIDNQVWKSQGGVIIASVLEENPDSSTLRSDLANETPFGNGASIVGYYDPINNVPMTTAQYLNYSKVVSSDTGTVNAIHINIPNANIPAYRGGMEVHVLSPAHTSTGLCTIQINSLPAQAIYRDSGVPSQPQDVVMNENLHLIYDGSNFVIMNGYQEQSGDFKDFGGIEIQPGWLACDGAAYSRTVYNQLFAQIGTRWGAGDGSTTFNIPNSARRTAVGSGGSGTAVLGNVTGDIGGEEAHALVGAENGPHTHTIAAGGNSASQTYPLIDSSTNDLVVTTASSGLGTPHNNIQPSMVVTRLIKI